MGGEKEKEVILQSIELMRFIITGIPCNVEKQHQLCASADHAQVLNGKDLSIGCNTAKWSCKHTKIYYDGRKKLNLKNANITDKIVFIRGLKNAK